MAAASARVLVLYQGWFHPAVDHLYRELPWWLSGRAAVVCVVFATVNALMEEVVFRGVLLDALTSQIGTAGALLAQAAGFGLGHAKGYPPGAIGAVMAGVFGLMVGLIRVRSAGLLGPWIAHVVGDVTIFWIVVLAWKGGA